MKQIIDFFKTLGGKNKRNRKKPVRTIHPEEIFISVIRRETSRYNRNKRPFSVITLDVSSYVSNGVSVAELTQSIASRIRISDDIGWLNEHTIGLLLSETPRDGTEALAKSLFDKKNKDYRDITITTYHYPSSEWPDMFF